jgi:hypothetical protein
MISLGSVDAQPCDNASVILKLQDKAGNPVSQFDVPTTTNVVGVASHSWELTLPRPGVYELTACDRGCGKTPPTETAISIVVGDKEAPDSIILLAEGNKRRWHLSYFGVIRRVLGAGTIHAEGDPPTITNVSGSTLRPCQTMLGSPAQVLELVDGQWREAATYDFPGDLKRLARDVPVTLKEPRVRVFSGNPDAEQPSSESQATARILKLHILPEASHYSYIGDDGKMTEPFIGFCDSYFIDLQ